MNYTELPQEAATKKPMIYESVTNRHLDTMAISTMAEKEKQFLFFCMISEFSRERVFLHMHVPHGQARAEARSF